MSEQIRQIAQVDDPIINNFIDTENKLNELNQEVVAILENYQSVNTVQPSFFNFDNPFFLLTLIGLIMLVLALWFLKQELKHNKPKKVKSIQKEKLEISVIPKVEEKKVEPTKTIKKTGHTKGRKIKVIKVK